MKALIIAPFCPYPLVFGGAIRLYHLIKMFSLFSDVTLLAYRSWSRDGDHLGDLKQLGTRAILVDDHPLRGQRKWRLMARAVVTGKTFQYYSHYADHFQHKLDALLQHEHFDYIVTDFSQMGYLRYDHSKAFTILDLHNIEHELLERRAQFSRNPIKKWVLAWEAKKFRRDELAICRQFDLVLAPSQRETNELHALLPEISIKTIPNSIDSDYFALRSSKPRGKQIIFVGTTQVDANRDGVLYFMDAIFPLIERRVPEISFTIIGGSPPPEIRALGERPNVTVTGFVPDVRPYMEGAAAMVVPLRIGGGTRLKILEGLAFGVPTISTSLGSEGINVRDGQHLMLADTPDEFADKVIQVLDDHMLQERLRTNGRTLVEHEYSWQAVGKQLHAAIEDVGRAALPV